MADVRSDIAGIVSSYSMEDGARVEAGETILEVECMKSLFPVIATAGGVIRYKVPLGETVGQDEIVAVIEES